MVVLLPGGLVNDVGESIVSLLKSELESHPGGSGESLAQRATARERHQGLPQVDEKEKAVRSW